MRAGIIFRPLATIKCADECLLIVQSEPDGRLLFFKPLEDYSSFFVRKNFLIGKKQKNPFFRGFYGADAVKNNSPMELY